MEYEILKRKTIEAESMCIETDRLLSRIQYIREEFLKEIDNYLFTLERQKQRIEGDAIALNRALRVVKGEKQHKEWRNLLLMRDKFSCQRCGKRENLEAHHIVPKSVCPNGMKWALYNGIILCKECHQEWHNNYNIGSSIYIFMKWLKND